MLLLAPVFFCVVQLNRVDENRFDSRPFTMGEAKVTMALEKPGI